MDEVLAQFALSRLVPRRRVRAIWFTRIRVAWPQIEPFVDYRRHRSEHPELWSELVWLATKAKATVSLPRVGYLPEP
jgi:hypothetical protein